MLFSFISLTSSRAERLRFGILFTLFFTKRILSFKKSILSWKNSMGPQKVKERDLRFIPYPLVEQKDDYLAWCFYKTNTVFYQKNPIIRYFVEKKHFFVEVSFRKKHHFVEKPQKATTFFCYFVVDDAITHENEDGTVLFMSDLSPRVPVPYLS